MYSSHINTYLEISTYPIYSWNQLEIPLRSGKSGATIFYPFSWFSSFALTTFEYFPFVLPSSANKVSKNTQSSSLVISALPPHKIEETKTKLTDKLNLILHSQLSLYCLESYLEEPQWFHARCFRFTGKLTNMENEGGNLGTRSKQEQSQDLNQIFACDFQNVTHNADWQYNNASTQGSGKPSKGVIFLYSSTKLAH